MVLIFLGRSKKGLPKIVVKKILLGVVHCSSRMLILTEDLALVLNIRHPYSNVVLFSSVGGGGGIIVCNVGCSRLSSSLCLGRRRGSSEGYFQKEHSLNQKQRQCSGGGGRFPQKRGRGFSCWLLFSALFLPI